MMMRGDEIRGGGEERRGGRILTRVAGKAIKEWENQTKRCVSGSKGGVLGMLRSPVGCVIRGMQGGGSGGRIKAV